MSTLGCGCVVSVHGKVSSEAFGTCPSKRVEVSTLGCGCVVSVHGRIKSKERGVLAGCNCYKTFVFDSGKWSRREVKWGTAFYGDLPVLRWSMVRGSTNTTLGMVNHVSCHRLTALDGHVRLYL